MIIIFLILFVLICIGSFIFYKKSSSKKENDQLNKTGSDSSIESELSYSIQSEGNSAKKTGGAQMFKVDDDL